LRNKDDRDEPAGRIMNEEKLRLMVVDDTAIYRQMLRNVMREIPQVDVVGAAKSGPEALDMIRELEPDLITLDVQMPGMTGIEVLRELRARRSRTKAIMVSSLTASGAQVTMDALLEGAFDFILKPNSHDAEANRKLLSETLTEKITTFRESSSQKSRLRKSIPSMPKPTDPPPVSETLEVTSTRFEAILIGTSTGGPVALREVIPMFPVDLPVPILVVQHMPPKYTQSLAERLNEVSRVRVHEAADGMLAEPGNAYIAPGGQHIKLLPRAGTPMIRVTEDPPEHGCRPAVDYLFRSCAETFNGKVLAIVLTGMGRDGTEGCRLIKRRGGYVITQHATGCTVYGMPKAVFDEGLSDKVLPLELIASGATKLIKGSR
jgi:two-component system, chemotaxis family, protein-glutamate methylesterase/glutaminase